MILSSIFNQIIIMRILIAQINPIPCDIAANEQIITSLWLSAINNDVDLIIFPELSLVGYTSGDALLQNDVAKYVARSLQRLQEFSINKRCAAIIGAIGPKQFTNSAFLIHDGDLTSYSKQALPNYGVFNEHRYFISEKQFAAWEIFGYKVGIFICEDMWKLEEINYHKEVDLNIVINASPFAIHKHQHRLELARKLLVQSSAPVIYVNCVGGSDNLVFDGGSFAIGKFGQTIYQAPFFATSADVINLFDCPEPIKQQAQVQEYVIEEVIYKAIVMGIRDYCNKSLFKKVVLGYSGGIDSTITALMAIDALGAENVELIFMPSQYTSPQTIRDVEDFCNLICKQPKHLNIDALYEAFVESCVDLGDMHSTTLQNIQARIRGLLLMTYANNNSALLLSTGNKSEMAVGYTTLYGDMCGGYAPLRDVYKTEVYKMAQWHNGIHNLIPNSIIVKEPTAELCHNQKDSDSIPEYKVLDAILKMYIEDHLGFDEIVLFGGYAEDLVNHVIALFHKNEFKRQQAAIGPKIREADPEYSVHDRFTGRR